MWAAAWINLPILTFWAFLTVSAYHFGEGDLNHMSSTMLVSPAAMYLSRGLMLIGSIATSQPTKTLPIIASMTRMQDASALLPNSDWIYRASIAQHIILTTLHVLLSEAQYATWATELWKCILFTGLFFALDPLTAFAVYFGIWHSLGSIADEIIFLKSRNAAWNRTSSSSNADIQMLDVLRFYRNAAPFTLLSVLGMLGFLLLVTGGHVSVDVGATTLWSVFVVSISILTGPHMWVMKNVNARVLGREGRIKKEGLTVNGEHLEEKDGLDPLGLEHLAVDWIVGGGWWWMPQNRKQP
ncbi:beta-carotene 15,15'-dioxygenase-domain-containing protein, partial [Chytriomyces sp. MP71]